MKTRIYTAPAIKGLKWFYHLQLTRKALKCVSINHGDQRVFSILNQHKCLIKLFPLYFIWIPMLYYGSTAIIQILVLSVRGPTLDVRFVLYRRQIMTSKVGPRPEGSTYQQNCWNLANNPAFQRQMLEIWNVWVYFRYLNLFTIQGYSENVRIIIRCSSLFSPGNSQKWLFVTILCAVTVSRSMNI